MTDEQLKEVLAAHRLYLTGEGGGTKANLSRAKLSGANLSGANLRWADLSGADLSGADLSGCAGFASPKDFLSKLERDELGVIVYKRIKAFCTIYVPPAKWKIEAGAFLEEVCNPDRGTECGCGVNVATREWADSHYQQADLWRCRVRWEDMAGIVIPFGTDGKFRADRVELIEVVQ